MIPNEHKAVSPQSQREWEAVRRWVISIQVWWLMNQSKGNHSLKEGFSKGEYKPACQYPRKTQVSEGAGTTEGGRGVQGRKEGHELQVCLCNWLSSLVALPVDWLSTRFKAIKRCLEVVGMQGSYHECWNLTLASWNPPPPFPSTQSKFQPFSRPFTSLIHLLKGCQTAPVLPVSFTRNHRSSGI